ncbi:MAG: tetratricopeptide repeat protein [Candidatus Obscuribacterales bacterium]
MKTGAFGSKNYAQVLIPLLVVQLQFSATLAANESSVKSRDRDQQALDERMREIREQAEQAREIRLVDTDLKYARAKEDFEKAKQNKHNVADFIHAAVSYAVACRNVRYPEKASRLYEEALDSYLKMNLNSAAEPECRKDLWTHLGFLSLDSLQSKFSQFFRVSEEKTSGQSVSELNDALKNIPREFGSMQYATLPQMSRPRSTFDAAQFWKMAIDIRSSVRGANSPELVPLLQSYASACESTDFSEAEKTYLRLSQITNKEDSDAEARAQLDMANLYIRHKMDDKAIAAYRKAFEVAKNHMSRQMASQFLSVASQYNRQSTSTVHIEAIKDLLSIGGDDVVQEVDNHLGSIVNSYISSFDLTRAQALLRMRLDASKTCTSDNQANHWRLKLSEVDLALGEEAESNRLFDQVKVTYALTGQNVDKLIEDRKKLIDALKSNKQATISNSTKTGSTTTVSPSKSK